MHTQSSQRNSASLTPEQNSIHERAIAIAQEHRRVEAALVHILGEADRTKLFKKLDCPSLFVYATKLLGLSESVAYSFISVARKAKELPELRIAISRNDLSVSKASRIVSGLNHENVSNLIQFAQSHTTKQIDFEMARRNPQSPLPDKVKPISDDLVQVTVTMSRSDYENLKRGESLLAQKGRTAKLGAVIGIALETYLDREDPVRKAERAKRKFALSRVKENLLQRNLDVGENARQTGSDGFSASKSNTPELCLNRVPKSKPVSAKPQRQPLSAAQKNAVFARDNGRCTHIGLSGDKCNQDRWIDLHHIVPVSHGGSNEPENLTTLCSYHHDLVHQLSFPLEGQVTWLRSPIAVYQVKTQLRESGRRHLRSV